MLSPCNRLQEDLESATHADVMATIDSQSERTLESFSDTLNEELNEELAALLLFGSAAGAHYTEGFSDVNVLIILDPPSTNAFSTIRSALEAHDPAPIDPLIVSRDELAQLPEAFPIETADLKAARRVLSGDDLIRALDVHTDAVCRQLTMELLGKTMRLRSIYAQARKQSDQQLRTMLSQAVSPFSALMRALLYVGDAHFAEFAPPREFLEVVAQLEDGFRVELEGFRQAALIRAGTETPDGTELTEIFATVLADAQRLQSIAQELRPEAP